MKEVSRADRKQLMKQRKEMVKRGEDTYEIDQLLGLEWKEAYIYCDQLHDVNLSWLMMIMMMMMIVVLLGDDHDSDDDMIVINGYDVD